MPLSIVLLLALLVASPLLFYLSILLVRRVDFKNRATDLGGLTSAEERFVWRFARRRLSGDERLSLFTNLNALCSLLTRLEQFPSRGEEERELCQCIKEKFYRRCAVLDRARSPRSQHPYQHTRELPVGLEVELFFKASRGNGYTAQILEQDRKGLVISYPQGSFGKIPPSWRGEPVLLCFSHLETGMYRFASEFDGQYFDRHFTTLRILHSNSFVLLQKRKFQRHKAHLRAWANLSPKTGGKKKILPLQRGVDIPLGERALVPCTIVNISSEGLKLAFQEKVYCSHSIVVHLRLLGSRVMLTGQVCSARHEPEADLTSVGVQFQGLTGEDRQRLYSFLYGTLREEQVNQEEAVAG